MTCRYYVEFVDESISERI